MNRGLLVFSILVIFAGLVVGYYAISIIGLALLIPALATTPKPKTPKLPTGSSTQQTPTVLRRQVPPAQAQQANPAVNAAMTPVPTAYSPSMMQPLGSQGQQSAFSYSSSLFPTTMFPSMSPLALPAPQQAPQAEKQAEPRRSDTEELLEVGLLFAIMKLVSS